MSIEIPVEDQKMILEGSVAAVAIGQCQEILFGIESIHEKADASEIIERILEIVNDHFYLIPKIEVVNDEPVTRAKPTDAMEDSIAVLWASVSN